MIQVKNLTKRYGQRTAINNLNFEIEKGEIVGFLGPNGAGKTTTMKMLTGFMMPTEGQIEMAGFDMVKSPIEAKNKLGYLPEMPPLYTDMTVSQYLYYVAELKKVKKEARTANVDSVIERLKLGDVKHRLIQNLSKGFRQRVGIAQALVSDPEILVFDEPTVGLDPKQVSEFRSILSDLKGNHTIIISTHILQEVQASCERAIIINNGEVVAQNTIEGLMQTVRGQETESITSQVKLLLKVMRPGDDFTKKLKQLHFVSSVQYASGFYEILMDDNEDDIEALTQLVILEKAGLKEIKKEQIELQDVFVKLTQNLKGD